MGVGAKATFAKNLNIHFSTCTYYMQNKETLKSIYNDTDFKEKFVKFAENKLSRLYWCLIYQNFYFDIQQ